MLIFKFQLLRYSILGILRISFWLNITAASMRLNLNINGALERNAERFLKIIPIRELLSSLKFKGILSSRQVEEIKQLYITDDMNHYLLNVLLNHREDADFYTFCQILEENNVNAVKRFAVKLQNDANGNIMINSY